MILFKSSDSFVISILADAYRSITGSKFLKFGLYLIKLIGLSDSWASVCLAVAVSDCRYESNLL